MSASRIKNLRTAKARMRRHMTILVYAKGKVTPAGKRKLALAREARNVLDTSGRNRVNSTKNWVEAYVALRS